MCELARDPDARGVDTKLEAPPSEFVESFTASMPGSYRLQYGEQTIREHAGIAFRRGAKVVHLELWSDSATDGACLCIVTDDRAGLLALVTSAIAAHSLDILGAKVFGRSRRWQADEAVDFFWVRSVKSREPTALDSRQVAAIADTIAALLRGELDVPALAPRTTPTERPVAPHVTDVHFDEQAATDLLVVDANDRPGLLSAITTAITAEDVLIVWSSVTTASGRAHDEFRVQREDAQRLTPEQRETIVRVVTSALAALR
jgi:UTP:GlnB (protein PII) uridylyltransferase